MKTFSAEALAALESGEAIVTGAVRFGLPSPVRYWGGHGSQTIGGQPYFGIGEQASIQVSGGTLGGRAEGAQLALSGVDPTVAAQVDLRSLRGVPAVLWWLIFDGSGRTLLQASVYLRGRVDAVSLNETPGGSSTLVVPVEGSARGLGRRSERMRSDADQQLIQPGDTGFKRVSYAGMKTIYAGGRPPERAASVLGGGSYGGGQLGGGDSLTRTEVF